MILHSDLLVEIFGGIKTRIEDVYNKYIDDDLSLFINEIIKDIEGKVFDYLEIDEEKMTLLEQRVLKTKRRWYRDEINNQAGLNEEVKIAKKILERVENKDKFELIYGLKNIEELKRKKKKELKDWYKDKDSLLIDFPHIEIKKRFQIERALINDSKLIAFKIIKEKSKEIKRELIINMPHSMSDMPINYTNKGTINILDLDSVVTQGNKKYFIDKYYIDDDKVFKSLIDIEILQKNVMGKFISSLNILDLNVFSYLLSIGQSSEIFYSSREVVASISEILKHCSLTDGTKNYAAVKESLFKMQHLTSGVFDSSLKGFTVRILDNVMIYEADGKDMVRVLFNIDIINQLVKAKTIKMYKDVIDKFKLPASKVLIFRLQRERVSASLKKENPLTLKVDMNFFRGVLYFSDRRKARNIKVVEDSLNEIIENKITLKKYERRGEEFTLEFLPIRGKERLDLIDRPPRKM